MVMQTILPTETDGVAPGIQVNRPADGQPFRVTVSVESDGVSAPRERRRNADREKFEVYAEWWHETDHLSMMDLKIQHKAYRHIVNMGSVAIPFILEHLRSDPLAHWELALEEITHEEPPIPQGFQEDADGVRQAWLDWAANR